MKHFLTVLLILAGLVARSQAQPGPDLTGGKSETILITKLGIPFGTIAKLEAEIYDGGSLRMKAYEGAYLLKINYINEKKIKGAIVLPFTDETGTLANDDFSLYKLIYKKKTDSLGEAQLNKMKEKYVGKKLRLMAYETGHFTGIPKGYFKYRPIRADVGFFFENYLVVVANLKR